MQPTAFFRQVKLTIDSFLENIHLVSSDDETIVDFVNFCNKLHIEMNCKVKGCKMSNLVDLLIDFLKEALPLDEKRVFYGTLP